MNSQIGDGKNRHDPPESSQDGQWSMAFPFGLFVSIRGSFFFQPRFIERDAAHLTADLAAEQVDHTGFVLGRGEVCMSEPS